VANFTALAAARHALLAREGWDVEARGLYGAPELQVVVSNEAHPSVFKSLGMLGLGRDRVVRVRGPEGVRTSRRQYQLLGLRGTLDPGGRPYINGHAWNSPEALGLVKHAAGADAWLEAWDGLDRFDILPLLVATDGAVAAFGRDIRRLRPNIVIGGVDGLDERDWPGAELHIGEVIIRLDALRRRCHMTTIDPDTLEVNPAILRDIVRRFDNKLALDAEVVHAGTIRVGDAVTIVRTIEAHA